MKHQDVPTPQKVLRAAVAAAGGPEAVGAHFGLGGGAVRSWLRTGRIDAGRIRPLCNLGGNVIQPEQLLDAMERGVEQRAKQERAAA